MAANAPIAADILNEAAAWLVRLEEGALSAEETRGLQTWRGRSPQHEAAWIRAQAVLGAFGQVPASVQPEVIPALATFWSRRRRRMVGGMGAALLALPAGWLAYRYRADGLAGGPWVAAADWRTALGEVREQRLPDGSLLVMNTDTAVDIRFDERERRIRLRSGEILLESAGQPDPGQRPLLVETRDGEAQALGTRYTVRLFPGHSQVAVYGGHVALRRPGASRGFAELSAGQRLGFDGAGQRPVEASSPLDLMWRQGLLVARGMRLDALLDELSRYRAGVVRAAPEVAGLRVSGSFSLRDTDTSLGLLADTLQVDVVRRTRYWVTLRSRSDA